MRKHVSNGKLMGMDIVLRPANSSYPNAPAVERIEVGPALKKSRVGKLHGRPYPVQFRNQGAFDAWKQTPLLLAARNDDTAMVDVLLAAGANADWRDWQGKSAIDLALASGVSRCAEGLRMRGRFQPDQG
jgi:hypothetical protein